MNSPAIFLSYLTSFLIDMLIYCVSGDKASPGVEETLPPLAVVNGLMVLSFFALITAKHCRHTATSENNATSPRENPLQKVPMVVGGFLSEKAVLAAAVGVVYAIDHHQLLKKAVELAAIIFGVSVMLLLFFATCVNGNRETVSSFPTAAV